MRQPHKENTVQVSPSPCSLVLIRQPVVLSRSRPPSPSQEPRGEARAPPPRVAGQGQPQPAVPVAQAKSPLPLSTTHSYTSSPRERQRQHQQCQGLVGTADGMKASRKPSDGLRGFSFGCMPQPRDRLAVPDPAPQAGLSSASCQWLCWTSQVQDTEATAPSPCHRDRNSGTEKRQLVEQLPPHMHITKQAV